MCSGAFDFYGYNQVVLTNTGYAEGSDEGSKAQIDYSDASAPLIVGLNDRAYFSNACDSVAYNPKRYSAVRLLGKRMRYTTDLSGADCGCNVAFYLVSMAQNNRSSDCGDYYCDANKVCGVWCSEIDIQEANMFSWHSTLHSHKDRYGKGAGYGGGMSWNGPRDFTKEQYGPGGTCIDTRKPFQVAASFPTGVDGVLTAMEVELSQKGKDCPLKMRVDGYAGMAELTLTLWEGMTPVVSYWFSKDMLWMDGQGTDHLGPCKKDTIKCGDMVKFYNFTLEDLPGTVVTASQAPMPPAPTVTSPPLATLVPASMAPSMAPTPSPMAPEAGGVMPGTEPAAPGSVVPMDDASQCTETGEDCRQTHCCKSSGMQCFEKNSWWAQCREACIPGYGKVGGDTTWTCRPLGARTPDRREHEVVMLSVAQQEVPPSGSQVTLVLGDQQLLGQVVADTQGKEKVAHQGNGGSSSSSSSSSSRDSGNSSGSSHRRSHSQGHADVNTSSNSSSGPSDRIAQAARVRGSHRGSRGDSQRDSHGDSQPKSLDKSLRKKPANSAGAPVAAPSDTERVLHQ